MHVCGHEHSSSAPRARFCERALAGMALLLWPLDVAVQVAVTAALLAVLSVLVFVAHPRRWWFNRAFDCDGFLEDDLAVRLRSAVQVIARAAQPGSDPVATRPAATVVATTADTLQVAPGAGEARAMRGLVAQAVAELLPSAALLQQDGAGLEADALGKRVVDMADSGSVLRGNPDCATARVFAECGALEGTPFADRALAGNAALCFALDAESLAAVRAGLPLPDLCELLDKRPAAAADDPGSALLLAAMSPDMSDADAWAMLRAELDGVAAVAAAVAQVRHAYAVVFPQLRRMRMDRRPDMDLLAVFRTFNRPYLQEFARNFNEAYAAFQETSDTIYRQCEAIVEGLKNNVRDNLDGKQHEGELPPKTGQAPDDGAIPASVRKADKAKAEADAKAEAETFVQAPFVRSTLFGVHVDEHGREVVVEEMSMGTFFKKAGKILSVIPKIVEGIADMIQGVVLIFTALLKVFMELRHGFFNFVVKLLIWAVNCALLVAFILWAPAIAYALWVWGAVVPMAVKVALYVVVLGVASAMNLVMAFADTATHGAVRHLALSEEHPESWFRTSGAHAGNRTGRFFGTLYACGDGYAPGTLPTYCAKVSRCVPLYSPAAMLASRLATGRLTPLLSAGALFAHPRVPSDDVACTRAAARYRRRCAAPKVTNGFTLPEDAVAELVLAACMGRMSAPDPRAECELCAAAVVGKHRDAASASAVAIPARAAPARAMPGSRKAAISVALAVLLSAAARLAAGGHAPLQAVRALS